LCEPVAEDRAGGKRRERQGNRERTPKGGKKRRLFQCLGVLAAMSLVLLVFLVQRHVAYRTDLTERAKSQAAALTATAYPPATRRTSSFPTPWMT
jgi:hypothetical protein